MSREQAINFLRSSGLSEEQINTIVDALNPKGDLISRQDAIDCFWDENQMMRDWLDIIKDIRSLPSENQWIICSERLPKENDEYLTTNMFGAVCCDYWNGLNFDRTEMVLAWMPLPEPWKGSNNEQ